MLLEWRLKQLRFKEQKNLNGSNLYLYRSITSYIQHSELRGTEKEEILQQVIDMMLQAQIEKKPMELIIGNDYQEFCKSIIEEYSSDKSKNYRLLDYIQKGLFYSITSSVFLWIVIGLKNSSFTLGITIDMLITISAISFILIPATRKSSQENPSLNFWNKKYYTINSGITEPGFNGFIFVIFAILLIRFILGETLSTKVFSYTITLHSATPYILLLLLIIGFIEIYKRMYNKRR
ncbi:DUF1048 domain-containing protein [Clostridium estertheticum]|uniref:DUF1048 domain-containing protein n=1 Tax=Clostridium estertheticum TaxID=238834 RepID=A0AA47I5S4_9CLOT|nr:DUF1048 domain-containing protein [Clostridium estertheticum]MBU3155970.1 DUF1048 domain-containing protein [Clostridium estertheticum]MBU3200583.1 DUF1048 domain-containing protein [Clostridium estertheticum]WAG59125.1 DUF1048 domain-containing protein [Clostridium estertheticum]WAG66822.1 DUF1048 domain-containing protein [Clostridium estertheticum]